MAIGVTVLNQVLMMFALMLVGYILYKKELLNESGTTQLSTILLQVCTPAIIINSFNIEFSFEILTELGIAFGLAFVSMFLGLAIGRILFGKTHRIDRKSVV